MLFMLLPRASIEYVASRNGLGKLGVGKGIARLGSHYAIIYYGCSVRILQLYAESR